MINYRSLTDEGMQKQAGITALFGFRLEDLRVAERFTPDYVHHAPFSGKVCLGVFEHEFTLPGKYLSVPDYRM